MTVPIPAVLPAKRTGSTRQSLFKLDNLKKTPAEPAIGEKRRIVDKTDAPKRQLSFEELSRIISQAGDDTEKMNSAEIDDDDLSIGESEEEEEEGTHHLEDEVLWEGFVMSCNRGGRMNSFNS